MVAYGHTPVPEPDWLNRTVNIDTGAVSGCQLTSLLYPTQDSISGHAAPTHAEPAPRCAAGDLRREAHGVEGRRDRLPGRACCQGAVQCHGRRDWHRAAL